MESPPRPPNPLRRIGSMIAFGTEMLVNPGTVGSAVPSSPALAARIASHVPVPGEGLVVELGAGTGPITAGLLKRGVSLERLISIELAPNLASILRTEFPGLRVIEGDACTFSSLVEKTLGPGHPPITCVVSSLPLRSLPAGVVTAIMGEIESILPPGGRYIQFTYDIRPRVPEHLKNFRHLGSSVVWLNVPPARVDVFDSGD
jgi:phosphatidylethanolamine/phosphatidyl-N-methylethanolamine N-methyltransferase